MKRTSHWIQKITSLVILTTKVSSKKMNNGDKVQDIMMVKTSCIVDSSSMVRRLVKEIWLSTIQMCNGLCKETGPIINLTDQVRSLLVSTVDWATLSLKVNFHQVLPLDTSFWRMVIRLLVKWDTHRLEVLLSMVSDSTQTSRLMRVLTNQSLSTRWMEKRNITRKISTRCRMQMSFMINSRSMWTVQLRSNYMILKLDQTREKKEARKSRARLH